MTVSLLVKENSVAVDVLGGICKPEIPVLHHIYNKRLTSFMPLVYCICSRPVD